MSFGSRLGVGTMLLVMALGVVGCTSGTAPSTTRTAVPTVQPTPVPSATSTPMPTLGPTVQPTPIPTLGPPWSPASDADASLVDRLLDIWTDNDVEALPEVYDPSAVLITGWDGAQSDLDAIRSILPGNPNTYTRVSGVTLTTAPVPGLQELPAGSRHLHCVTRIHGSLFDVVLRVDETNRIVVHYVFEYEAPDFRVDEGFPGLPTPAPSSP